VVFSLLPSKNLHTNLRVTGYRPRQVTARVVNQGPRRRPWVWEVRCLTARGAAHPWLVWTGLP